MSVTRDIARDLLPAYASGTASAETRAAVEEWLAKDADLRAELTGYGVDLDGAAPEPAVDTAEQRVVENLASAIRRHGQLRTARGVLMTVSAACPLLLYLSWQAHATTMQFALIAAVWLVTFIGFLAVSAWARRAFQRGMDSRATDRR